MGMYIHNELSLNNAMRYGWTKWDIMIISHARVTVLKKTIVIV